MSNLSPKAGFQLAKQEHTAAGQPMAAAIPAHRGHRRLPYGPGSTALVTGASGGIGEEFAIQLAGRGASLVLVARQTGRLEQLRTALLDRHPGLVIDVVPADLSEPGAAAEVARRVDAAGRRIDVLINNAGAAFHGQFAEQAPERIASQIQLNAASVAGLTARFLPPMLAARHGLVINVASTAAFQPVPTMAVYAATKAFVLSFTEALWQETRGTGVRVLALCPGATETGFFAAAAEQPFMTHRRQTPQQVVHTALTAAGKTGPTVVSGRMNQFSTLGPRFMPRRLVPAIARQMVR
ncbi:MAG TPA: SDR family oxidoreductase [Streptosporangiaceae bacterium]|nr:SDR family oxidoreductase [Streptosporangiaceae bacterium]